MERLKEYRNAFRDLPDGSKAAEVNLQCRETTKVSCRKGSCTALSASEKNMLFVRATGENTGTAYCENLNRDPEELIELALENASVIDVGGAQPMLKDVTEKHVTLDKVRLSAPELMDMAREWSLLWDVEECAVSECIRYSLVLNSLGTETIQICPVYTVSLDVPGEGEDSLRSITLSRRRLEEIDIGEMIEKLWREEALEHRELPYISLCSGTYDALISARMTVNIMNTAWQLFAARLIDAGRSPLAIGYVLGSEVLNINDRPIVPWSGYDFTIDAEGVRGPAENRLVERGVVTGTLRTLRDGDSTGCAGRADLLSGTTHTELISVPRNIYLEPGSETPEELLARMKTGIHLTYSMDEFHSLDIAGASFSIPCGGVYYEDGRPVGRLQQMNICGSFKELFSGLEAVGNDMSMKAMWPVEDYCFGGPSMLVRNANFAM